MLINGRLAIVRGGGDLATGIVYRLWRSGFKVLVLETQFPLVVRRTVAVASAVFNGNCIIDGMLATLVASAEDVYNNEGVSVFIDPEGNSIRTMRPDLLVDAIMAKINTGTNINMAPLVVGIGPGFTAKVDVHYVVETKRGHYLGHLISEGGAIPNTGIPGAEMGYTVERLLKAPNEGYFKSIVQIGDSVEANALIGWIGANEVRAGIGGVVRGLIHPSVYVSKGLKIGDIDPRNVREHCFSITDKALAIAGGVLEAVLHKF